MSTPEQPGTGVVKTAPQALAAAHTNEPQRVLAVISQLTANPTVDPNAALKLLELYERLDARHCEQVYKEALAELQAGIPQIARDGVIELWKNGQLKGKIKYAKLEDIDSTIRPMLARHGFAFSFGSDSNDGKFYKITGTLSHRLGHSEDLQVQVPIDTGPGRSVIQAVGSTISYGRRMLVKMFLNIVEKGEDVDGADLEKISGEQLKDLDSLIKEVKADEQRFLKFMGVEKLDQILVRDLQKATTSLEQKRRRGQ